MAELRKAALLAAHNFQKWPVNPRVYVVFLLELAYVHWMVSPVGDFCAQGGYTVGPWVFPFLLAEPYSRLMVMLGLILLLCDAPFIESDHPALLLRSGRRTWTAGQVLYIAGTSALYFAVVYLLTVLVLLPHVGFEPGWGKVIRTFCQTRMAGQHGIVLPFDHQISNALGPVEANLLELLLCWLLGTLLGLVLFVLNLTVNRSAGAICAAALAIFPLFVERAGWWMHYISPVSWASLSVVDLTGTTAFPSLGYALAVLAGGNALLALLAFLAMGRRDIDVLKSV